MMTVIKVFYQGLKINYQVCGPKEGQAIVMLHGWGQNIEMMKMLGDAFNKNYRVLLIDFPGHGKSSEPDCVWQLSDFVELVHTIIQKEKMDNPYLVGHSFGGKVSLLYASKYPVRKLVLLASPFRPKITKLSLKTRMLKKAKNIPGMEKIAEKMKKHIGSTDYRNASPIMRKILVDHINTDITEEVKKIKCPTLLIWGNNDTEVDIKEAYELEQLIKDAGVVEYEGCTHYAYLEQLPKTVQVLKVFFK